MTDQYVLPTYGEYLTNLQQGLRDDQTVERECTARLITFALGQDHWNYEWNLVEVAAWLRQQIGRLGGAVEEKRQRTIYTRMLDAAENGWMNEPINSFAGMADGHRNPALKSSPQRPMRAIDYDGQAKRLLRHRIRAQRAAYANVRISRRNGSAMF